MADNRMLQAIMDKIIMIHKDLKNDIQGVEKRLTARIDKIGSSVAYLEDDTPTLKEFNKLEKRVTKVEKQLSTT